MNQGDIKLVGRQMKHRLVGWEEFAEVGGLEERLGLVTPCGEASFAAKRDCGVKQNHVVAADGKSHAIGQEAGVIKYRGVAKIAGDMPVLGIGDFFSIESGPDDARAGFFALGELLRDVGDVGGVVRIPLGVGDEKIGGLPCRLEISDESAVGLGNECEQVVEISLGGVLGQRQKFALSDAIAGDGGGQAVLHEPPESDESVTLGGVFAVRFSIDDLVEYIVVIAAEKDAVGQVQEQVDDGAGIRAAIDIVAGEDEGGARVVGADGLNQPGEGLDHSVDVANDPMHG
jgi:hypothetical protein